MPSGDWTRRGVLAAGGACVAGALAGCSRTEFRESSSHRSTVDLGGTDVSTHEYEVLFARAETDSQFVFPDEDAAEKYSANGGADSAYARLNSTFFVLDDAAADTLRIETAAADLRSFVAATDFESESIVVEQRSIGDCYYRELTGVEARDDDFRFHLCRWLKEPTTRCEADKRVMEAIVIRVARPYRDRPSSSGSSESMVCRSADSDAAHAGNRSATEGDSR
ncbi:hypothetical protein [Halovivax cerinus]|uniref:Uncharacterized protein n=1 Tax=Halovivax cerinus TaxID=1487865 RepID=A0ABD5NS65_9EURY|nr:hypothetical protein [Halovivax cerinus]